jgi:hypothetical protein
VGIGITPSNAAAVIVGFDKSARDGMRFQPSVTDTPGGGNCVFLNTSSTIVGTIMSTASATSYNTSSDIRLKRNVQPLTASLERIRALRPVSFRWNADDSPGIGFLAHELQQTIPEAVTGQPDEVNEDGSIRPQQVDHSRLVPHVTAAIQDLLAMVDSLTARVAALEGARA